MPAAASFVAWPGTHAVIHCGAPSRSIAPARVEVDRQVGAAEARPALAAVTTRSAASRGGACAPAAS